MEDNEVNADSTCQRNEWEYVSLTSSAYAASPGSTMFEGSDYTEAETSKAMLMLGNFVFPPSQHENLPLESDVVDILKKYSGEHVFSDLDMEEGDTSHKKGEEELNNKSLSTSDVFLGPDFPENKLCLHITDNESTTYEMNTDIPEIIELADQSLNFPAKSPKSSKHTKDINNGTDLPCEAWWKRRQKNALWSIFISAAVMGFVIFGQRWQQEKWQKLGKRWIAFIVALFIAVHELPLGFIYCLFVSNVLALGVLSLVGEGIAAAMDKIMGPISRLKDVIVGGHRRGFFISGIVSDP